MNFISIKFPPVGVSAARQALKLLNAALSIVSPSQLLQVIADQLVETFAQRLGALSGSLDGLLIYGESYIH
jgi:hypothetical protein